MSNLKPIHKIDETLRKMNRTLDTILIDSQNIKSDIALIKMYIQKKHKEEESDKFVEVPPKGWW